MRSYDIIGLVSLIGVVSGKFIFAEPLRLHFGEEDRRKQEEGEEDDQKVRDDDVGECVSWNGGKRTGL